MCLLQVADCQNKETGGSGIVLAFEAACGEYLYCRGPVLWWCDSCMSATECVHTCACLLIYILVCMDTWKQLTNEFHTNINKLLFVNRVQCILKKIEDNLLN